MNLDCGVKTEGENVVINCENSSDVKRDRWSKDIEFLMSCIALSVGLGNIWRFPFTGIYMVSSAWCLNSKPKIVQSIHYHENE